MVRLTASMAFMAAAPSLALAASRGAGGVPLPPPAQFSARIDNPWYPLPPGRTLVYVGAKDGQPARDVLRVTRRTMDIAGVPCAVISDRLYERGRLAERTTDWYSQDGAGTVWYFGEATATLDRAGRVMSTEGSWRAGEHRAEPGVFMPARPRVGQTFQQEFFSGHAEDRFVIKSLQASVRVPRISAKRGLLTEETTRLEPGVVDHKLYVRGLGTVREQTVRGGREHLELVAVRLRG